jgi:pimeloyl-ACP methyl ester carboxylesterase
LRVENIARLQQLVLTISVTVVSRFCLVRDRILRRIPWDGRMETAGPGVFRHTILSGEHLLDAVFVKPVGGSARASLLLCHGIGEVVEHWQTVQQMLAAYGVASLVFDYSGYGRSSGFFNARQAEQDAVAAFRYLERLTGSLPVSVLGLSLGSPIAVVLLNKVPVHRLVLCAAFTSLRNAAASAGFPRAFTYAAPPIWDSVAGLRDCSVPALIVHGEKDRLFPVSMAEELAAACRSPHELIIVPKVSHNEPFYHPQDSYWGETVARFLL